MENQTTSGLRLDTEYLTAKIPSLWYFGAAALFYQFVTVILRVYFSPLSKFPGPKIAAATAWYEGFFDLYKANFPEVLDALHDQYGTNMVMYIYVVLSAH